MIVSELGLFALVADVKMILRLRLGRILVTIDVRSDEY